MRATGCPRPACMRIYSEASIGKAVPAPDGRRPLAGRCSPTFPTRSLGIIMSTYFGGRSEVRIRREICRVLYCDFLSMYPTVTALMGLWRFVIAGGVSWHDATAEITGLGRAPPARRPAAARVLAQAGCAGQGQARRRPACRCGPLRAGPGSQHRPQLPDRRRRPVVHPGRRAGLQALDRQDAAHPAGAALRTQGRGRRTSRAIDIMGKAPTTSIPTADDLYKRLVELRSAAKRGRDEARQAGDTDAPNARRRAAGPEDHRQRGLLRHPRRAQRRRGRASRARCSYWGFDGTAARQPHDRHRGAGAVLSSPAGHADHRRRSAACLGIAEHLAEAEGIGWAFCDTDSFALARPAGMTDAEFIERAQRVRPWFEPLNPYDGADELFKLEEQNYRLRAGKPTASLRRSTASRSRPSVTRCSTSTASTAPCCARSRVTASAICCRPMATTQAPQTIPAPRVALADLGVGIRRWQHDLWYLAVQAALEGHPDQVDFGELPGFDMPALSRYAATTPELLSWFAAFNKGRPYREQVRPFGFLTALQVRERGRARAGRAERRGHAAVGTFGLPETPRVVAPFDRDPAEAARHCFERATGRAVPVGDAAHLPPVSGHLPPAPRGEVPKRRAHRYRGDGASPRMPRASSTSARRPTAGRSASLSATMPAAQVSLRPARRAPRA